MAGRPHSNAYTEYLEAQLERITSAALVSATFDERLVALERRLAATDENVLASIRLVKSAENGVADAARAHEHRACALEREARSAADQADAQRHLVARLERELDRTRSSVESMEARLADARREAAIADKLRADERRAAEQAMGALRRELVDASARMSALEGGRPAASPLGDGSRRASSSQPRGSEPGSDSSHRRSGADSAAPGLLELEARVDELARALAEGEARAIERLRTVVLAVDALAQPRRSVSPASARASSRASTPGRSPSPAGVDAHEGAENALFRARARLAASPTARPASARPRSATYVGATGGATLDAALWERAARTTTPRPSLRRASLASVASDVSVRSHAGVGAARRTAPADRAALGAAGRPRPAPATARASGRAQWDAGRSAARPSSRRPSAASVVSDAPSKPAVRRPSLARSSASPSPSPSPRGGSRASSLRGSARSGLRALLHELR